MANLVKDGKMAEYRGVPDQLGVIVRWACSPRGGSKGGTSYKYFGIRPTSAKR